MQQRRVLTIAGTRPEAIKLAPLVRLLARHEGIAHCFVATGQHGALFHRALADFDLHVDFDLELPNVTPDAHAEEIGHALPRLIRNFRPDLLLVQGDTTSAWAAALTAAALGVPVGHVEAGLRSGNPALPWPEERNRREIDGVATLLFAPSEGAAANLVGLPGEIHVTGNTGIDALLEMRSRQPLRLHEAARKLVLVTCHRREAVAHLAALASAILRLAARPDVTILLPVHANPAVGGPLRALLGEASNVQLTSPLDYPELVSLLGSTHLLLTDSGGLQEEAPALGLPALILRDVTERPEPVASGNAQLVGLHPDRILRAATRLLDDTRAHALMSRPAFPYGRGDAAPRIVEALARWLGLSTPLLFETAAPPRYA